jgi:hypothetical protein
MRDLWIRTTRLYFYMAWRPYRMLYHGYCHITEASSMFLESHDINFVEIHSVVKFLANGLCKSDIYESVETPFLCM